MNKNLTMKNILIITLLTIFCFQLNSQESLEIVGGLKLQNSTGTQNGIIRFTGTDFEGRCNGIWHSLTQDSSNNQWTLLNGTIYNNTMNVGIGTSNPTELFHLHSNNYTFGLVTSDASYGASKLTLQNSASNAPLYSYLILEQFGHNANGSIDGDNTLLAGSSRVMAGVGSSKMLLGSLGESPIHLMTKGITRLFIEGSMGNIGMGTTNPTSKLHIKGNGGILNLEGQSHSYIQFFPDSYAAGRKAWTGFGSSNSNTYYLSNETPDGNLILRTDNTDRLIISNNGSIGIGSTSNPLVKLQIENGTDVNGASGGFIQTGNTSSYNMGIDNNEIQARVNGVPSELYLQDSGGDLIMKGGGNVGIGIANPEIRLQVGNGTDVNGTSGGFIQIGTSTGQNIGIDNNEIQARVNGVPGVLYMQDSGEDLIMKGGGNVGIGIADPLEKLHIGNNGNIRLDGYLDTYTTFNTYAGGPNKSAVLQIDPHPGLNTSTSSIRFFSSTNTSADVTLYIFKGNGTSQHNHAFRGNGNSYMSLTGNLGIGTTDTQGYKFAVKGNIGAEEIEVKANYWADFVFDKNYPLKSLKQVKKYIQKNGHLPDVPSEKEAISSPLNLAEMNILLLQKIEELTLYTISQEEKIILQDKRILEINDQLKSIQNYLNK